MNPKYSFILLAGLTAIQLYSSLALAQTPVDQTREAEGKNAVATINRSQQAYHFERQTFATDINQLGVVIPDNPYYSQPIIASTDNLATVIVNAQQDDLRSFSGAITYNEGTYNQIICQSDNSGTTINAPSLENSQLICPSGSSESFLN
ncbi:MAG: hypothetical protein EA365_06380 [Gloeocapsa sp. DLM2.Bin57]|nr:MAG: hypothetical protein EA365_06380 [Gloeocapsa sp. DLM2.Bin57]